MGDDFGTVSARRAKEIELLRKHRESLVKMLADVDAQLRDLGEITSPVIAPPAVPPRHPARPPEDDDSLGSRPILNSANTWEEPEAAAQPGGGMRVVLIFGAAVLAFALIGWLIWRASSDRPAADATIEETTTPAETTTTTSAAAEPEPGTIAPVERPAAAAAAGMIVTPRAHDYGLVRKGTRATRQFSFRNDSDDPVTIALARSQCRCLFYEYEGLVPPKATESITVTVDGAKAKAGTLRETISVTPKSGGAGTSFDVIATVR
ncbi:MAG TPA: DUF1573 domain-containing protein [Thermoanaerobaculia bacterium]|nr:DUF1573 domain-containing protein [Thermoanaerobaculia bacterium]